MQLLLTGEDGAKGSDGVEVSEAAFGASFNEALVHQVVVAYLAGARSGSRAQKSRAEVRGGGAKPWRQKGTGRARAGSIRSPIWRGGGVTFAARPAQHNQKVNRKMYRAALRSVLSELVRQERLMVVEQLQLEAPKTSELAAKLRSMELGHVLIIVDDHNENLLLSARNLPGVDVLEVAQVDPVSLVAAEKVVITVAGLRALEERLA